MRQLSYVTNLLSACAAAALLVVSLALPWYAVAKGAGDPDAGDVGDVQGPLEEVGAGFVRIFTSSGSTVSGSDAFATADTALMAVAGVTAMLALLVLANVLRDVTRDLLRFAPLAAPALVAVLALDRPNGADLELRWGLLVSLAIAGFMASAAWHGSQIPDPKPRPAPYQPPAPPPLI